MWTIGDHQWLSAAYLKIFILSKLITFLCKSSCPVEFHEHSWSIHFSNLVLPATFFPCAVYCYPHLAGSCLHVVPSVMLNFVQYSVYYTYTSWLCWSFHKYKQEKGIEGNKKLVMPWQPHSSTFNVTLLLN